VDSFIGLVSALPPGTKASFSGLDHHSGNTADVFVLMK
jgi:hypothetical protein